MSSLHWITERPIAHRGLHDGNVTCWENSLSAFKLACEKGFAIECDVNLSGDGVPMVFHDDALDRLTGIDGFVHEHNAVELKEMAIGGTSDLIPTLDDLLEVVAGNVPLVIELKGKADHDGGLVAAVAERLSRYRGQAAIMSFDHWLVRQFPLEAPDIPRGLTAEGKSQIDLEAHFSMLAHQLSFVSFNVDDLPNPFVSMIRSHLGMPVITWTVRTAGQVALTKAHADQMTFEGFDPSIGPQR